MASNFFGEQFRFTTWGESHGPAIGCVIDGCPAGVEISEEDIQLYLDRRRPGQSKFTTQRQEADKVNIMSGVFEGITTGTPISLIVYNEDQRSKDYSEIKDKFRPSHADYTYQMKYGIRDYRGGGRSSARETAMRVAAGAIARKVINKALGKEVTINGTLIQMGQMNVDRSNWNWNEVNNNPFFLANPTQVEEFSNYLEEIRKTHSSVGAMIETHISGLPVGLGEPIYHKMDSEIAKAIMSINAVKSVEIGSGSSSAAMEGKESVDEMRSGQGEGIEFLKNNAGGILGGISTGQDIIVKCAVKPTSSILAEKNTINKNMENDTIVTKGRHDPCVGIRAVPVVEAMLACVVADMVLRNRSSRV